MSDIEMIRAKWRAAADRYRATVRGKAVKDAYNATEQHKSKLRAYQKSDRGKKAEKEYKDRTREKRLNHYKIYRASEHGKAVRAANRRRERSKEVARLYRETSPKYKAYVRSYFSSDKGKAAKSRSNARRRTVLENMVVTLTDCEWENIKNDYDHRCVYCAEKTVNLTRDHVIPLSRGGHHVLQNVVPACVTCNSRKWAGSLPFKINRIIYV